MRAEAVVVAASIREGWRKVATSSPSSQVQLGSTKVFASSLTVGCTCSVRAAVRRRGLIVPSRRALSPFAVRSFLSNVVSLNVGGGMNRIGLQAVADQDPATGHPDAQRSLEEAVALLARGDFGAAGNAARSAVRTAKVMSPGRGTAAIAPPRLPSSGWSGSGAITSR